MHVPRPAGLFCRQPKTGSAVPQTADPSQSSAARLLRLSAYFRQTTLLPAVALALLYLTCCHSDS